jgi:exodeoxyribonuclease-3
LDGWVRIATWNVNSVLARVPRLVEWLEQAAPDVVCLQETKVAADAFPAESVEPLGYEVAHHGEGRWNGVAVLSRVGLADVVRDLPVGPGYPDDGGAQEARTLAATCGPVRVRSVYVPNGRAPDDPHYAYKLRWLEALRSAVEQDATGHQPFALTGDFNIAPGDADVWDPAAFIGSTHVTPQERAALQDILATGLTDVAPRIAKGEPFTYWDYRAGSFHKGMGMRIDLVLANAALTGLVKDAWIDREARKGKAPSDHAPVVIDLAD